MCNTNGNSPKKRHCEVKCKEICEQIKVMEKIDKKIKNLCDERHINRKDFFKKPQIKGITSESAYYRYLNGQSYINVDKLKKLADYLGLSYDYLFKDGVNKSRDFKDEITEILQNKMGFSFIQSKRIASVFEAIILLLKNF